MTAYATFRTSRRNDRLDRRSAPDFVGRLTTENAHLLRTSGKPVLVHCMAAWAAPCRSQAEEIAALARTSAWRFDFLSLDVFKEEELAAAFAVRAVPTLLVMRNGKILDRFTCFQNAARLRSALVAAEAVSLVNRSTTAFDVAALPRATGAAAVAMAAQ